MILVWRLSYQRLITILIIANLLVLLLLAGPGYVSPAGGVALQPRIQAPAYIIVAPTARPARIERDPPERQARPEPTATAQPLPTEAPPLVVAQPPPVVEPVVIYVEVPAPTVAPLPTEAPPAATAVPSHMVLYVPGRPTVASSAAEFVASFEEPAANPFVGCLTDACREQFGGQP